MSLFSSTIGLFKQGLSDYKQQLIDLDKKKEEKVEPVKVKFTKTESTKIKSEKIKPKNVYYKKDVPTTMPGTIFEKPDFSQIKMPSEDVKDSEISQSRKLTPQEEEISRNSLNRLNYMKTSKMFSFPRNLISFIDKEASTQVGALTRITKAQQEGMALAHQEVLDKHIRETAPLGTLSPLKGNTRDDEYIADVRKNLEKLNKNAEFLKNYSDKAYEQSYKSASAMDKNIRRYSDLFYSVGKFMAMPIGNRVDIFLTQFADTYKDGDDLGVSHKKKMATSTATAAYSVLVNSAQWKTWKSTFQANKILSNSISNKVENYQSLIDSQSGLY